MSQQATAVPPIVRQNSARDPFRLLVEDHAKFRELFGKWSSITAPAERKQLASELAREIVSHASIEEQYVHELYHRYLGPEGQRFFDDSLRADQENIKALQVLEHANYETEGQRIDEAMQHLMDTEFRHMREEEEVYFPRLSIQMGDSETDELYDMLARAKERAPTHAHPMRPDKPTLAKVVHPIAGALDRAKDALFGRPA